ncbi:MAG: hypothetical protein ACJARF_002695 [Alteromonadaceae bacterium]|jgi:hypothetical protein
MRKTLFISLIISSLSATAIVVRHDVADEKYLAKGVNLQHNLNQFWFDLH